MAVYSKEGFVHKINFTANTQWAHMEVELNFVVSYASISSGKMLSI